MSQKNRFFRPYVTTILVCFLLLVIGTGVFVWRATQSTQPPTPPSSSFGTILYHTGVEQPITKRAQAQSIMSCFAHAYQHCTAMSMDIHDMGVDTGYNTIYWPQPQGNACHILAQTSNYGLVGSHSDVSTGTCQGVLLKNYGLLLQGCGNAGDVSRYM